MLHAHPYSNNTAQRHAGMCCSQRRRPVSMKLNELVLKPDQASFLKPAVAQSVLLWRGQTSSTPLLNPEHPLMGPHPTD